MAELDVGTQCHLKSCQQLDFLPFKCDNCLFIFCLEHREPRAHDCKAVKISTKETESFSDVYAYQCFVEGCSSSELVPVKCSLCSMQVCLKHRIPEDHNCIKLPTKRVIKPTVKPQESSMARTKFKKMNVKQTKMACKIALMKLKQQATGNGGLPNEERVYFAVHPESFENAPIPMFFSQNWTIGKIIDFAAEKLKLQNVNNSACDEKLKLCSAASGNAVSSGLLLKSVLATQTLFNGSSIIICYLPEKVDSL